MRTPKDMEELASMDEQLYQFLKAYQEVGTEKEVQLKVEFTQNPDHLSKLQLGFPEEEETKINDLTIAQVVRPIPFALHTTVRALPNPNVNRIEARNTYAANENTYFRNENQLKCEKLKLINYFAEEFFSHSVKVGDTQTYVFKVSMELAEEYYATAHWRYETDPEISKPENNHFRQWDTSDINDNIHEFATRKEQPPRDRAAVVEQALKDNNIKFLYQLRRIYLVHDACRRMIKSQMGAINKYRRYKINSSAMVDQYRVYLQNKLIVDTSLPNQLFEGLEIRRHSNDWLLKFKPTGVNLFL